MEERKLREGQSESATMNRGPDHLTYNGKVSLCGVRLDPWGQEDVARVTRNHCGNCRRAWRSRGGVVMGED